MLSYITNMSLDGYIEDRHGAFDFGPMDDDVFAVYTELLGTVGTFLYGRRLYETMAGWETAPALAAQSSLAADFARAWQAPSKIVYSTTLATAPTASTRIERAFDITAVQQLKADASRDLTVGGADLASQALTAGLVDECILFVWPVAVGDGKPAFPADARLSLELVDERAFANGVLLLRYRPKPQ
ncbi:MAG: deaminase-reductase protein [Frankiales bacterium]|nr:deaminase-reductase protein [Frankiales bacterium]